MRRLWLLFVLVIFCLAGCSRSQAIGTKEVKEMLTNMQSHYDFLYYSSMYKAHHPDRLVISYISFQNLEPWQIEDCFESTKVWITKEENLNQIQKHLGLTFIPEINIRIQSQDKVVTYTSYYYKKGSRDSQHKGKDAIDHFATWDVFTQ